MVAPSRAAGAKRTRRESIPDGSTAVEFSGWLGRRPDASTRAMLRGARYFWIVGVSSVGKNTFIERLQADAPLRRRFGIRDDPDAHSMKWPESIKAEGLVRLYRSGRDVVVKWQLQAEGCIMEVARRLPRSQHTIVHLWRRFDDVLVDLKRRDAREGAKVPRSETELPGEDRRIRAAVADAARWCYVISVDATENRYGIRCTDPVFRDVT